MENTVNIGTQESHLTFKLKTIFYAILVFFVFVLLALTIKIVNPGTVKVVTQFGRVTGRVLEPGFNLIIPFAEGTMTYNTKKLTYEAAEGDKHKESKADYLDFPVTTTTNDGQQVKINYTVRFSVDSTKVAWLAQNIGTENSLVEKVVKTDSRIHSRNIAREFNAAELYTGNVQEYQKKVEDKLRDIFSENGLMVDEFGVRDVIFSPEYVVAVERKQIEKENVITARNVAERAEEEKKAKITQAEAEAAAQKLQQQTITSQLLQKWWIETWNGILPQYMLGDSDLMINLSK